MGKQTKYKKIPGIPGYGISKDGRVWSYKNDIEIRSFISSDGYNTITLIIDGKSKTRLIPRLVALTWIGPPEDPSMVVYHKDENGFNNHVDNLCWMHRKDISAKFGRSHRRKDTPTRKPQNIKEYRKQGPKIRSKFHDEGYYDHVHKATLFGSKPGEIEQVALMEKLEEQGLSRSKIAAELNHKGLKPRRAKRWTSSTVGHVLTYKPVFDRYEVSKKK